MPLDVLDAVLSVSSVRGTVAAVLDAAEPWGLTLDAVPGAAMHAVVRGTACLRLADRREIRLMPGDVVLLPAGDAHTLASAPDIEAEPFDHVAAERALASGRSLVVGSGAPRTRILCASYRQDPTVSIPLLSLLPAAIHIPAGSSGEPMHSVIRLLTYESTSPRPGAITTLNRIVEVLLVHMLRTWLLTEPARTGSTTWLSALVDPVAGPALAAIHNEPGRPWTVDSLAATIGVSRATLARRFPEKVGVPPATYLVRWRMDLAAKRLRDTDEPVHTIARTLGYTSEYAFNRAFARVLRMPPGRYRTHSRLRGVEPRLATDPGGDLRAP
jgi:AraC-like DNA-binding protein